MKRIENPRKEILVHVYDHHDLDKEYEMKTSVELLEIIDSGYKSLESDEEEEKRRIDWKPINKAENVLAYRLTGNLIKGINEDLQQELIRIIARQNELIECFLNHRHDKDKSYTEKPVW